MHEQGASLALTVTPRDPPGATGTRAVPKRVHGIVTCMTGLSEQSAGAAVMVVALERSAHSDGASSSLHAGALNTALVPQLAVVFSMLGD